jgi:hypothetical protein
MAVHQGVDVFQVAVPHHLGLATPHQGPQVAPPRSSASINTTLGRLRTIRAPNR